MGCEVDGLSRLRQVNAVPHLPCTAGRDKFQGSEEAERRMLCMATRSRVLTVADGPEVGEWNQPS